MGALSINTRLHSIGKVKIIGTKIKPKYALNLTESQEVILEVVDNKTGNGAGQKR
jgi:hypothetical protein